MEEQPGTQTEDTRQERPALLKVLCILTFIWSGYQVLSNLMIAAFYDQFTLAIKVVSKSFNLPGIDLILQTRPLFFGVTSAIYVVSLAGAMVMWQMKKAGFHIYTVSQILLVLAPMYFLQLPAPNMIDVFISGIFILLYSYNLKKMV